MAGRTCRPASICHGLLESSFSRRHSAPAAKPISPAQVWPRLPEIFASTPCSLDSAGRSVAMLIESRTDCGVAAGFSRL